MTDADNKRELPMQKLVQCHRTGREFDLCEHQKCPYCYGQADDIASGKHEKFCDYKPGVDPVSFGFPDDSSRNARG